jgi:hypothetical protein
MTGPEHYAEAERLLKVSPTINSRAMVAAQAHATLALAAATALSGSRLDEVAWLEVAATRAGQ